MPKLGHLYMHYLGKCNALQLQISITPCLVYITHCIQILNHCNDLALNGSLIGKKHICILYCLYSLILPAYRKKNSLILHVYRKSSQIPFLNLWVYSTDARTHNLYRTQSENSNQLSNKIEKILGVIFTSIYKLH